MKKVAKKSKVKSAAKPVIKSMTKAKSGKKVMAKAAPKKAVKVNLKPAKSAATKKPQKVEEKPKVAAKGIKAVEPKGQVEAKGKAKASVEIAPEAPSTGKKLKKSHTPVVAPISVAPEEEVILTNADGKQYCRVHDCDNEATTENYCRYHYLALWKRNKIKAKILQGGKLDKYIEDLTAKYPDKYLEMLRKDLASEKDFNLIVAEMDVEDSGDEADNEEETSRFIEEVRGGMPTPDDDEGF